MHCIGTPLNYWREGKAAAYNRDETAAFIVVLKETFTWSLTSTPMFSKTISHIVFPPRKTCFVSYHLWSVSLSSLLHCQPFLCCLSSVCSFTQRNAKTHFWGASGFSHSCIYTLPKLQLQATTQPVTWFLECLGLHCPRLTPHHTVQRVQLVHQITSPRISSPLSLN